MNNGQLAFTMNCIFEFAMATFTGAPFTISRIAGFMLMKMAGGSFFTGAPVVLFFFWALATSRSREIVMVAAGLRKVLTSCSIWVEVAGSSDGKLTLVILGSLSKTVCASILTDRKSTRLNS